MFCCRVASYVCRGASALAVFGYGNNTRQERHYLQDVTYPVPKQTLFNRRLRWIDICPTEDKESTAESMDVETGSGGVDMETGDEPATSPSLNADEGPPMLPRVRSQNLDVLPLPLPHLTS